MPSNVAITDGADRLVAPQAWEIQQADQRMVDAFAARLADAQARLAATKSKVDSVLGQILARAGVSVAPGQTITAVVVGEDGSVTVTIT